MNKFEVPSVFAFVKNSIHRSAINTSNNIWEFCKHEIMQKRYRIPGEIFTCIVNDPCLLCFTCRKVRCAFSLTLRLEFVDTENLAVYLPSNILCDPARKSRTSWRQFSSRSAAILFPDWRKFSFSWKLIRSSLFFNRELETEENSMNSFISIYLIIFQLIFITSINITSNRHNCDNNILQVLNE